MDVSPATPVDAKQVAMAKTPLETLVRVSMEMLLLLVFRVK